MNREIIIDNGYCAVCKDDHSHQTYIYFNEKCKNCHTEMKILRDEGENTYGTQTLYWCPNCGTILDWYDAYMINDDNWKTPKGVKNV